MLGSVFTLDKRNKWTRNKALSSLCVCPVSHHLTNLVLLFFCSWNYCSSRREGSSFVSLKEHFFNLTASLSLSYFECLIALCYSVSTQFSLSPLYFSLLIFLCLYFSQLFTQWMLIWSKRVSSLIVNLYYIYYLYMNEIGRMTWLNFRWSLVLVMSQCVTLISLSLSLFTCASSYSFSSNSLMLFAWVKPSQLDCFVHLSFHSSNS